MAQKNLIHPNDWSVAHWPVSPLSVRFVVFSCHFCSNTDLPKKNQPRCLVVRTGSTYPLDLVRSRLSIATASIPLSTQAKIPSVATAVKQTLTSGYHTSSVVLSASRSTAYTPSELTMWGMTLKVVREEGGVRGLYRGLVTTAMGVAPYVGINFAAYEFLRGVITPPGKSSIARKLTCGALAGKLHYPASIQ